MTTSSRELWSPAAIVLAGNLVARGLGFLFPLVVARATDEDGFALVYFFITTGWFVSELVLTGFPTALTRRIAAEDASTRGAWVVNALAGGLPLLVASLLAGAVLAAIAGESPLLMAFVVVGLTIDAYYFALLRGLGRFALLAGYRVAANLFQIAILLAVVAGGASDPTTMVAIYSFVYLVPIAIIEARERPLTTVLRAAGRPTRGRVAALTRFAVPSLVSGVAYATVIGVDVFFVRVLAPDALADYSAARTLALPATFLPYAIAIVLLPRVAAAGAQERWTMLRRVLAVSCVAAALAALLYAVAGPFLLDVAFPSGYRGAEDSIGLLGAALGIVGIYSVLSQWWLGSGRPGAPAVCLGLGALATLAGHATLTAHHGAVGAAASIAIGATTALLLLGSATLRLRTAERTSSAVAA